MKHYGKRTTLLILIASLVSILVFLLIYNQADFPKHMLLLFCMNPLLAVLHYWLRTTVTVGDNQLTISRKTSKKSYTYHFGEIQYIEMNNNSGFGSRRHTPVMTIYMKDNSAHEFKLVGMINFEGNMLSKELSQYIDVMR